MTSLKPPDHVDLQERLRTLLFHFIFALMQIQNLNDMLSKTYTNFNLVFDNEGVRFTKISRRHKR